jgi:hypothetical protein
MKQPNLNPYAPSQTSAAGNRDYYAEEITAMPFRPMMKLFSQMIPFPLAVGLAGFFLLRGLLRWPLKASYAGGPPGTGRTVSPEQVPRRPAEKWAPFFAQMKELGLRPIMYRVSDIIGAKEGATAMLLDPAGTTILTVEWMRMMGANGIEEQVTYEFNSYSQRDPEILTGAAAKEHLVLVDAIMPSFVDGVFLPIDSRVADIYRQHLERIRGKSPFAFTAESALTEHLSRSQRRFDDCVQRGILRKLDAAEIAAVRQKHLPGGS